MYLKQSVCVLLYVNLGFDCWNNTASHLVSKKAIKKSLVNSIEDSWNLEKIDDGLFIIDDEFQTSIMELIKSFLLNATESARSEFKTGIGLWLSSRSKSSPLDGVKSYPENLENKMKLSAGKFKDYLGLQLFETPIDEKTSFIGIIKYTTTWPRVISSKCSFTEGLKFQNKIETFTTIFGNFIRGEIDDPSLRFIILPMDKSRRAVVFVPINKTTADVIYDNIESVVKQVLKVNQVRTNSAVDTMVSLPPMTIKFSASVIVLTKENTISITAGTENNCASATLGTEKFKVDKPFVVTMMSNHVILGAALVKTIHP